MDFIYRCVDCGLVKDNPTACHGYNSITRLEYMLYIVRYEDTGDILGPEAAYEANNLVSFFN